MVLLFYNCVGCFSFSGQDVIMPRSNFAIIAWDSLQKHKLAPFHRHIVNKIHYDYIMLMNNR